MSSEEEAPKPQAVRSRRPVDIHVGGRIRLRRKTLGMGRSELARDLGLSVQQIQKYESGDSTVAASRLHEIGIKLAVPASYFFEDMAVEVEESALPRIGTVDADCPTTREIRQMVLVYQAISNPELRHQIYELARALAKAGDKAEGEN